MSSSVSAGHRASWWLTRRSSTYGRSSWRADIAEHELPQPQADVRVEADTNSQLPAGTSRSSSERQRNPGQVHAARGRDEFGGDIVGAERRCRRSSAVIVNVDFVGRAKFLDYRAGRQVANLAHMLEVDALATHSAK